MTLDLKFKYSCLYEFKICVFDAWVVSAFDPNVDTMKYDQLKSIARCHCYLLFVNESVLVHHT